MQLSKPKLNILKSIILSKPSLIDHVTIPLDIGEAGQERENQSMGEAAAKSNDVWALGVGSSLGFINTLPC
jgi:hypothetical protein